MDYQADELLEGSAAADPFTQFTEWFAAARDSDCPEPNAVIVATVNAEGHPAARVVLLKQVTDRGFVFYTNYESDKGRQIEAHPHVAMVFNWLELQRQVRIEGRVERLDPATSTAYFQSRPRKSQVGAWVSPQSEIIPDRDYLVGREAQVRADFKEQDPLPRPPHWGGYLVVPERVEFWQGRSSRLHDRLRYRRSAGTAEWLIERLAP